MKKTARSNSGFISLFTSLARKTRPSNGSRPLQGLLIALLLICQPLWAQTIPASSSHTAIAISGVILDPQNAAVVGALVEATNPATHRTVAVRSDREGFRLALPAQGLYKIAIKAEGFAPWSGEINAPLDKALAVHLSISSTSSTVEVLGVAEPSSTIKIDVPVQEMPLTVASVPSSVIVEQSANDLVSALRNVSNVASRTGFGVYEYYVIRGFSSATQLVDGVRNEGNRINTQTNAVERIEVLKGPASVLFGNDAIGGAINLVRKKPSPKRGYEVVVGGGKWDSRRFQLGATGKLGTDRLLYRGDFGYDETDTFRGQGRRRINVTPGLIANISSRDRLSFYANINRDRFGIDAGIPLVNGAIPNIPMNRRFNTPNDFELSHDYNYQFSYTRKLGESAAFRDTFSFRRFGDEYLGAETLAVVNGHTVTRQYQYFFHHRRPFFNQADVSARFKFLGEHHFSVGYELQRYSSTTDRSSTTGTKAPPMDLYAPVETAPKISTPINRYDNVRTTIDAVYFQNHWSIGSRLKLLIGGREDFMRRWQRYDPISGGTVTPGTVTTGDQKAFTGRGGAVYEWSSWTSTYASFATAFVPNYSVQANGSKLNPETGRQWEAGQRFRFLGGRLDVTPALFSILRKNVTYSLGGGNYEQAGQQRAKGAEIDINGRMPARISVVANYGYVETSFRDYLSGSTNLTGRRPQYTPKHTANLWLTREWGYGIRSSIGMRYVGALFTDNTNKYRLGGYTIWDAALSYKGDHMEYAANISNLFNKKNYFVGTIFNTQIYPGSDFGLSLTARFHF